MGAEGDVGALVPLDPGLAPDLPESDPLALTTAPSRPPSPVGLAAKKALPDLTAAKRDPSSPGLDASTANYEELPAHFEPLGEEQAEHACLALYVFKNIIFCIHFLLILCFEFSFVCQM